MTFPVLNNSFKKSTEEFFDFNLDELEREVRSKFKDLGMNTPRNNNKRNSIYQTRSNMRAHSQNFDDKKEEQKILAKAEKERKQENMLADLHLKQSELIQLIEAMSICHEARKIEGIKNLRTYNNEEKSILNILRKMGIEIEIKVDDENDTSKFTIKYKRVKISQLSLVGINCFSKSRGRMSVLAYDEKKDKFILFSRGGDSSMRRILKFNQKDKMAYRQLMMANKVKGLKRIVYGKKEINKIQYKAFITNFRVISKMKRNQAENFESLAKEYEKDMLFIGSLGVKNIIDRSVKDLISSLLEAKLKVSMFTGDVLENTLLAAKDLNLSTADFNDSSSYYSLKFVRPNEGFNQIKRILEKLYEHVKINSIFEPEKFKKPNKRSRRRSFRLKTRESLSSKTDKPQEQSKKIYKTLLINGETVQVISDNKHLETHFKLVLSFCRNIMGYSLNGKHKAFLTACLKETSQSVVLACGDGFNDMAMLREANIGVQLSNKEVPLIFGDIVITNVSALKYLIFIKGKTIFDNMTTFNIIYLLLYPSVSFNLFFANGLSLYSGHFIESWCFILGYFWLCSSIVVLVTSKNQFNEFLIKRFPIVYQEKRSTKNNLLLIYAMCVFSGLVESVLVFLIHLFLNRSKPDSTGYMTSNPVLSLSFFIPWSIGTFFKLYFIANNIANIFFYINIGVLVFVSLFMIIIGAGKFSYIEISIPIWQLLARTDTYVSLCYSLGATTLVNWLLITLMKKNILSPIYYEACNQFNLKNLSFFKKGSILTPGSFIPKIKREELSLKIRRIFKNSNFMDDFVKKIISLENSLYSFGVSRIYCRILDTAENKRYQIHKRGWEVDYYRDFIGLFLAITILEMVFVMIVSDSDNYFVDVQYPYLISIMLIPFASTFIKQKHRKIEQITQVSLPLI